MFGIKIIKKSEYDNLVRRHECQIKKAEDMVDLCNKEQSDNQSLREQLGDKMKEINKLRSTNNSYKREIENLRAFKRDTLAFFGKVDLGSFRIQICNESCKPCDARSSRYSFGDYSFCIRPKQES